jgi:hypothetical protein
LLGVHHQRVLDEGQGSRGQLVVHGVESADDCFVLRSVIGPQTKQRLHA